MHVEVIRDVNALRVRWRDGAGNFWTVKKRYNLNTHTMEEAQVDCSAKAWPIEEGRFAQKLARDLDAAFLRPEDFDRVKIADQEPASGLPAQIVGIALGGYIYIAIAPRGAQ